MSVVYPLSVCINPILKRCKVNHQFNKPLITQFYRACWRPEQSRILLPAIACNCATLLPCDDSEHSIASYRDKAMQLTRLQRYKRRDGFTRSGSPNRQRSPVVQHTLPSLLRRRENSPRHFVSVIPVFTTTPDATT